MTDDYHGGDKYDISGKTAKQQADSILTALDKWLNTHDAESVIVWLNPSMQAAGAQLESATQRSNVTVKYHVWVKPVMTCAIEGAA